MGSTYFKKRCLAAFGEKSGRRTKPKAFKSEEKANDWAKANGLTKFTLENLDPEGRAKIKIRIQR